MLRPVSLALLAALAFAAACRRPAETPEQEQSPGRVTVLYTCDTRGTVFPTVCDAPGGEGGLARRERWIRAEPAVGRLLVDAGDFSGDGEAAEARTRAVLGAYARMGYHAVNLGHREARLSAAELTEWRGRFDRLISANLVGVNGEPVMAPYRVERLADGCRVGLIGITDDALPPEEWGEGLAILSPDTALGRWLPEVKAKSDVVILLAFADEETLLTLANLFAEIDLVVGGKVNEPTVEPLRLDRALAVAMTGEGRRVGQLELERTREGVKVLTNRVIVLSDPTPDEAAAAAAARAYEAGLKDRPRRERRP